MHHLEIFPKPAGIGRGVIAVGRAAGTGLGSPARAGNEKGPREGAFGHRLTGNKAVALSRRSGIVAVSGNELDAPSAA
jgi:hypothetical protein